MRTSIGLNHGWDFTGPDGRTESVDVPHTWNALDGQDGGGDYWRGSCTYARHFGRPSFDPTSERVYLQFDGVNASADVTLNGSLVAHHDGGYSTFRTDVTDELLDDNQLVVTADNSDNDRVYPQRADFTFYGGIYRDVTLMVVAATHFSLDHWGGPGFAVTPALGGDTHKVRVQSWVDGPATASAEVRVSLLDASGVEVASGTGEDLVLDVAEPHLWDGTRDPYRYVARLALVVAGETIDEVSCRFGIRTFRVDPKEGFFLNGRPYPLRGVCRHQDRKGVGNALTTEMHREDMELIREVGANTIRLAHYQHSQTFYDLCDEAGMVVWAEIPYISMHMSTSEANANTEHQMRELIVQNYNHPSIVCWGLSNEITIYVRDKKGMLENNARLNDLCHELDPTRFTTLACYAMCGPFNRIARITDVVSWNLYLGWYVPGLFLNDLWMGFYHLTHPNRCLGLSEYGAEAMCNLHSSKPRRGDQTEEYQAIYHEYLLRFFDRHPYLWATHVWNMFDFAADARDQGGEPGMNHKGLVTFDRTTKKDSFFLYKVWWNPEPMVHLCGKRYVDRPEAVTTVKVYSNQPEVTLLVNGEELATKAADKVFEFKVPLAPGENAIEARAGALSDTCVLRRVERPNPSYVLKGSNTGGNWV